MSESITNRVAQSALVTFDLEDYWPQNGTACIDLADLAPHGLIREAEVRSYVQNIEKHTYDGSVVCLTGSDEHIVPQWLGPLLASSLAESALFVGFGTPQHVLSAYYAQVLAQVDWNLFRGAKVLVKGCGNHPVPDSAYSTASWHLARVAQKVMYGEACSNVPLFKSSN